MSGILATTTPAPSAAASIAHAVAALPALPPPDPGDRYNVHRLTASWLAGFTSDHTRRAYFRDLAGYLAWCEQTGLDPLTARSVDLGDYGTHIAGQAPATAGRRLSAVSSWYASLVAGGILAANPMDGVKRPKIKRDASTTAGLTEDEVRALLDAVDAHAAERLDAYRQDPTPYHRGRHLAAMRDRALLRLLADLGLRVGEAIGLDISALGHNRGHRTVQYVGKGGAVRERSLDAHTIEALDDYLAARVREAGTTVDQLAGPLFVTTARDGDAKLLDEPAVFRLIRRLATAAGIPSASRLSPHSLRHAFATNARQAGVPLEDVQDAMGHADPRTTRRYDRGRHNLDRDPGLKLGSIYGNRAGRWEVDTLSAERPA